jgi:uncharacterized Zn finger protein (UPF0148 family)
MDMCDQCGYPMEEDEDGEPFCPNCEGDGSVGVNVGETLP